MKRVARGGARLLAAGIAVIGAGGCGSGSTPHGVAVPNVIGTTAARATQELESAGLRVATRVRWNGDPVAHVLAQEPAAGPAKRSQTISLVVSARGRLVPSVVGQPVGTAVAALRRRGFAVAGGRHTGVVAAQRPTHTWSRPHAVVRLNVVTGDAAVIAEVNHAYARQAPPSAELIDVRCAHAGHPRVFTCSGYSRALAYRMSEIVEFTGRKVELWQPPPAPKTAKKHHHGHHAHGHGAGGRHGHHAHTHAHAGHGKKASVGGG